MAIDGVSGTQTFEEVQNPEGTQPLASSRSQESDNGVVVVESRVSDKLPKGGADTFGLPAPAYAGEGKVMTDVLVVMETNEQASLKANMASIKDNKLKNHELAADRMKKIQEARDKANSPAGKIAMAFAWLAAAIMLVVGAVTANPALVVAAVAVMAVLVLQQTGLMANAIEGLAKLCGGGEAGQGIATGIMMALILAISLGAGAVGGVAAGVAVGAAMASLLVDPKNLEKMGVSKDIAGWLSMGLNLGLSVVALGSGIATAVGKTAEVTSKLAGRITEIIGKVAQTRIAQIGGAAIGVAGVAGGGLGVKDGVNQIDMSKLEACALEILAAIEDISYSTADNFDRIQSSQDRTVDNYRITLGMIQQEHELDQMIACV